MFESKLRVFFLLLVEKHVANLKKSRDIPKKLARLLPYEQLHEFAMMKTRCGVKQGLWKCWFSLQNEIKTRWGDSKNEVGLERD